MPELPAFLDEDKLLRANLIRYGERNWSQEDLDQCLQRLGFEPTSRRIRRRCLEEIAANVSVYVIAEDHPESSLVKVGVSNDPDHRCRTLEREKERNLWVAYRSPPVLRAEAMRIERWAHGVLDRWALGGEWFLCGTKIAISAVAACGGDIGDVV